MPANAVEYGPLLSHAVNLSSKMGPILLMRLLLILPLSLKSTLIEKLVPREGLEGINDLAYCEVLWSEVFYSNLYRWSCVVQYGAGNLSSILRGWFHSVRERLGSVLLPPWKRVGVHVHRDFGTGVAYPL